MTLLPPRPLLERDNRQDFDCGEEALNYWFKRHAWTNHRNGDSRVYVIANSGGESVAGFVAVCSALIERAYLPKSQQRNRPESLPVTLLGQLAVDRNFQGRKHADTLLLFALRAAIAASEHVGSSGVITHPLDDDLRAFYARWGFESLSADPSGAMMVRMIDLRKSLPPLTGSPT